LADYRISRPSAALFFGEQVTGTSAAATRHKLLPKYLRLKAFL
jgi:hypothetical protein